MKSEEKLYNAITELPDELVEEASETAQKEKKAGSEGGTERSKKRAGSRRMYITGIIAACLVCALIITAIWTRIQDGSGSKALYTDMLLLQVQYPKAYGFNDYEANTQNREQHPVEKDFYEAVNGFSYETASALLSASSGNMNYSPISLYYALAVMAEGAKGDTREELLKLLGVTDTEELREQCNNLYHLLYTQNEIGQLTIGSSLWIDKSVNIRQEYVDSLAQNYFTESYRTDFSEEAAYKAMEEWVFDRTKGLKPEAAPSKESVAVFMNTIYYYDEWVDKFNKDKTEEDIFYVDKDTEVRCDFMNSHYSSYNFAVGDGWTRSSMGLKNSGGMVFVLPDEGVDVHELLSSPERLYEVLNEGTLGCGEVVWQIPKFSFGSGIDLNSVLSDLGIRAAFSQSEADFGEMGTIDGAQEGKEKAENIFVGRIFQNTHIAIDENGVEAKAFTRVDYAGAAMPDGRADMILNRPFLYAIKNWKGVIVFVGICENPVLE